MASTYSWSKKTSPANELVDDAAPKCKTCSTHMGLTLVETKVSRVWIRSRKRYECTLCGAGAMLRVAWVCSR